MSASSSDAQSGELRLRKVASSRVIAQQVRAAVAPPPPRAWSCLPKRARRLYAFILLNVVGYVPDHQPLGVKVKSVHDSPVGVVWDLVQLCATALGSAMYVWSTYDTDLNGGMVLTLESVVFVFYAADYLMRLVAAPSRWRYLLSPLSLIDACVLGQLIAYLIGRNALEHSSFYVASCVRLLRLFRAFRLLRAFRIFSLFSPVLQQSIRVALILFLMTFVLAGIMNIVEEMMSSAVLGFPEIELPFFSAFYFAMITVATIGYGDVSPSTELGKAVVVLFIILVLYIIPDEVKKVEEIFTSMSQYRKPFVHGIVKSSEPRHVIVVGEILKPSVLNEFLAQFYHQGRLQYHKNGLWRPRCFVMSPEEPTKEIKELLHNPRIDDIVSYYKGSVFNRDDLLAVGIDVADAIFVLSDPRVMASNGSSEYKGSDHITVLNVMVCRSVAPLANIFSVVHSP